MFLRIQTGSNETIYQCEQVHVRPHGSNEIMLVCETGQGRAIEIQVPKSHPNGVLVDVLDRPQLDILRTSANVEELAR